MDCRERRVGEGKTMTQLETDRIKRLFKLADVAQEFESVDLKLVDHFSALREEYGLSTLLLLIYAYVKTKTETQANTPETPNPNQNKDVVQ